VIGTTTKSWNAEHVPPCACKAAEMQDEMKYAILIGL